MPFVTGRDHFDFKPLGCGLVMLQGDVVLLDHKCGKITVPSGFVCDLASYPRLARPFFDRLGKSMRGAVVHDYLYEVKPEYVDSHGQTRRMGKFDADRIFRDALREERVRPLGRWLSWAGVAVGGWWAWWT